MQAVRESRIWILAVCTVAFVVASTPVCKCPRTIRKVCGSDSVTYDNLCAFHCAKRNNTELFFLHNGTCCPSVKCIQSAKPICDNFGKTHNNECLFEKVACVVRKSLGITLSKAHDGICDNSTSSKSDCKTECTEEFSPICDDEGNSYLQNQCEREKQGKSVIGVAKNRTFCLPQANLTTQRNGLKRHISGVESYRYYTGSVETYSPIISDEEELALLSANSTTEVDVHVTEGTPLSSHGDDVYATVATPTEQPASLSLESLSDKTPFLPIAKVIDFSLPCSAHDCDKSWSPVCDTRNRTHKNICLFKFYACKVNRVDGSTVDIAHEGACLSSAKPSACINCPKDETPIAVCDNRNETHATLCAFIQFNCNLRNVGEPERVLVHIKVCHSRSSSFELQDEVCPTDCKDEKKPVCDEANNTHDNLCCFQRYNCNMRKLGIRAPYLRYLRNCSKVSGQEEEVAVSAAVGSVAMHANSSKKTEEKTTTKKFTTTTPSTQSTPIIKQIAPKSDIEEDANHTESEIEFDCPKPSCPTEGLPVCDSKGNLHGNLCEFAYSRCLAAAVGEQLRIAAEENCVTKEACQMPCTGDLHPICASDFSTYDNLCHFRKQKCLDSSLEVLFKGKCSECLDSPCPHPPADAPDDIFVCAEDGTTRSLCEYQMLNCIFERGYGVNLTIQYIGTCCPKIETCDNAPTELICASNGQTFSSKCELEIENCKYKKLDLPKLTIVDIKVCEERDEKDEQLAAESIAVEGTREIDFNKQDPSLNCSIGCDNIYEPVCATNSLTYVNLCTFQKAQCNNGSRFELAYTGECCSSNCPNDFSPVCDNNGKTHQNLCKFGFEQCVAKKTAQKELTITKIDVCDDAAQFCDIHCTKEYLPVCTEQGETIVNECELNRINCLVLNNITTGSLLIKEHDGQCCTKTECSFDFSPVCDSQGTTHANECIFKRKACIQLKKFKKIVTLAHKGQCCNHSCPDTHSPVCDGKTTHPNVCKFRAAQCEAEQNDTALSVAYQGECCPLPDDQCRFSGPVCDSDGQTHASQCWFQQRKCVVQRIFGKSLNIVHSGECCSLDACPEKRAPICDTHGTTHGSECHFRNTKCIYDKIHVQNSTLHVDYTGECCNNLCTSELLPICDQHGNIFRNECLLKFKSCEKWKRTQELLLPTPCPLLRV